MKLNSTALVSDDLVKSLKTDLARANVCRFGIAYFSMSGLAAIDRGLLANALCNSESFGVSSMSCACGYQPLLSLSGEVAVRGGMPRLKYFMDPLVEDSGEPDNLALFHSKIVYLVTEDRSKSVLYIGSHNWSRRALGPGNRAPRNAEATVRIEGDFDPYHLGGIGGSVFADANQHLLNAFNSPLCIEVSRANEHKFEEWFLKGCKRKRGEGLRETKVILAIHQGQAKLNPVQWESLANRGIYVQMLIESEGRQIWDAGDNILILVWDSEADLQIGNQPHLLRCRISTEKAGPKSELRGTNSSSSPISGFSAVIWDQSQHQAIASGRSGEARSVRTKRGQEVNVFDFDFPSSSDDSRLVDGHVTPKYQFYLEIDQVVFPVDGDLPDSPRYAWLRSSLAFADDRKDVTTEEIPGYSVNEEQRDRMIESLREVFGVDLNRAKVLPFSGEIAKRLGKKVVDHPLHDTFLDDLQNVVEDEFYSGVKTGELAAEIDSGRIMKRREAEMNRQSLFPKPLERTQRVFTMRLDILLETWEETAESLRKTHE